MSAEYAFFLAMVLFPDVQKKAQAEIDAFVGNGRLPTFADSPNLPYVNALVYEVLRWNTTAPLGIVFIGPLYVNYLLLLKVHHMQPVKMAT